MKTSLWRGPFVILYAAAGAAFLWAGTARQIGVYAVAGVCFLALAAWEGWTIFRELRTGWVGRPGWSPALYLGCVIVALCQIHRSVIEPTDFNTAIAAGWSLVGAVWAVRAVRESRSAGKKKERPS